MCACVCVCVYLCECVSMCVRVCVSVSVYPSSSSSQPKGQVGKVKSENRRPGLGGPGLSSPDPREP